jgi:hypothetical protein
MRGQWVGYGRDFDLVTGPWTLELVSSETGKEAIEQFNRPGGASQHRAGHQHRVRRA